MTITRGNNYKRKEGEEEARGILRKNYNGGKNRYNSGGGLVEGGGQREKMATRGKRLVKERGTSEKRSRGREEWRFAQRQFINHTTTRGRPRRAISSFILINNACQESGLGGGKPWSRKQFHPLLYDSNGDALFPSLKARSYPAQRRGGRRKGRRKGERERRIKKKSFSSTERRMISAAAVDYRQGNYFRWNGEAKERKRIEQPPIPAHLVIQVKSKAGYGRGSRSINVFSFPFKRCPVELLLLPARFSPAASSLQFLSSPPSPLPFLFPVRSSIEL